MSFGFLSALLTGLLVAGCSTDKHTQQATSLDSILELHPGFHGVVLTGRMGEVEYFNAVGFKNPMRQIASDTSAIFELASVSKTFTATIILQLIAEHRIGLGDSLRRFFPELPYHGITIRHLLNHTGGLPDYQAVMDAHWDKSKVAGNEECLEYLSRYQPPILFQPGTAYAYSNTGYLLLASIAEQITDTPFDRLLSDRIFNPLGMESAALRTAPEKKANPDFAFGYIRDTVGGKFSPADSFPSSNYTIWLGNRRGPGRVSMRARDLFRFGVGILNHSMYPEIWRQEAFSPVQLPDGSVSQYGFGWEIWSNQTESNDRRHTYFGHLGDNPGYKSLLLLEPKSGRVLVLLSNSGYSRLEAMASEMIRTF